MPPNDKRSPAWEIAYASEAEKALGKPPLRVVLVGATPAEIKEAWADMCENLAWPG